MAHLLRVFIDENGNYGDAASIVIDEGRHIADIKRQEVARELNTGETIFINDLAAADISVMHPQGEIGFAGVGVVGAAWLLAKLRGKPTERMRSRDGEITTWQEGDITWARGPLSIMPPWNYKQLEDVKAVEQIKLEDTKDWQHTMTWAWIDEAKGLIRARTFATDWDIPEAQGNGSGSMVLAAKLERTIQIKHGEGSVIFAKPASEDCADIGGRVTESAKTILMNQLDPHSKNWLNEVLAVPFSATKHAHSHQDEVFKIGTSSGNYYLKTSKSLRAEHDNLKKLENILTIPKVIDFYDGEENDFLLISELPGKNLVELMGEWSNLEIVDKFAEAIKQLHSVDATKVFPEASPKDVLLHGDMALPNIIISDNGNIGYIDFGQLSFGDPELDLGDAIWSLQRNLGPDYGKLFLEKYGPVTMTSKIQAALDFRHK